jgi:hypothetical protein
VDDLYLINQLRNKVMDAGTRQKRVEALEAIKNKALEMAVKGNDSIDVRGFVKDAKMNLAFELPDYEAFEKAKAATLAYRRSREG